MAWLGLDLLLLLLLCAVVVRLLLAAHFRARRRRSAVPANVRDQTEIYEQSGNTPRRDEIVISTVTYICDPIDGTAFAAGELVFTCHCGTAYRKQSQEWLTEFRDGRCMNCGAEIARQQPMVLPL